MQNYDIRIFNKEGTLILSFSLAYLNDDVAIHAAQKYCEAQYVAQVWRDDFWICSTGAAKQ